MRIAYNTVLSVLVAQNVNKLGHEKFFDGNPKLLGLSSILRIEG